MNKPKVQEATISCPFCKTEQKHNLYPIVDLEKNPSLKLGILTDSLFTLRCRECNSQFSVMHEMLVLDKEASLAILLAPESNVDEVEATASEVGQCGVLRLVSSSDELKEKILLLDAGLDDKAIELAKLYILMQMEKPGYTLLYASHQVLEEQMLFTIFNEKGEMEETIQYPDSLYLQLLKTSESFPVKQGWFVRVNSAWAYAQIKNSAN